MTTTPTTPAAPPTWTELATANPSLLSWERSAASAGRQGLCGWSSWMQGCAFLRGDVHHALPTNATAAEFTAAWKIAAKHLSEIFDREHHLAFPLSRQSRRR